MPKIAKTQQGKFATKQAKENREKNPSPINGQVLPDGFEAHPERRHNGAWRKEDTLRHKLQHVAKLDKDELRTLLDDKKVGEYEKSVARILLDVAEPQTELTTEERWRILNGLTNQDSGMPKQQVEQHNIKLKPILPKLKKEKK